MGLRAALRTLTQLDWRSARLVTALTTFLWGVINLADPTAYYASSTLAALRGAGINHVAFAVPLIIKGAFITWMILQNKQHKLTAIIGAMFWVAFTLLVYLAVGLVPGLAFYILFSLINAGSYMLYVMGRVED